MLSDAQSNRLGERISGGFKKMVGDENPPVRSNPKYIAGLETNTNVEQIQRFVILNVSRFQALFMGLLSHERQA